MKILKEMKLSLSKSIAPFEEDNVLEIDKEEDSLQWMGIEMNL